MRVFEWKYEQSHTGRDGRQMTPVSYYLNSCEATFYTLAPDWIAAQIIAFVGHQAQISPGEKGEKTK